MVHFVVGESTHSCQEPLGLVRIEGTLGDSETVIVPVEQYVSKVRKDDEKLRNVLVVGCLARLERKSWTVVEVKAFSAHDPLRLDMMVPSHMAAW
jgi:hypothetical protein